ncbi:MAG: Ig-like domain-containing protein, partial [Lachnospiraceae bacterium]|nr:Ig-like domain-containing protein [Lachnospiraceae bacterium]
MIRRVLALAVSLVMFFSSAVPVSAIARAVTLNYSTLTLEEGGSAQLQMEIGGTRADAADWRSDQPSVADVSSSGLVTAKNAGSATISCDSG